MIEPADITAVLQRLGLGRGPVLVHTDLSRCLGLHGRTRDEKLDTLLRGIEDAIGDGPLLVPAYTYSYCRGEDFDPAARPARSVCSATGCGPGRKPAHPRPDLLHGCARPAAAGLGTAPVHGR